MLSQFRCACTFGIHDQLFDWRSAPVFTDRVLRLFRGPPVWQLSWRGYAAVLGGIIVVAYGHRPGQERRIAGGVISTARSADRSSTDA